MLNIQNCFINSERNGSVSGILQNIYIPINSMGKLFCSKEFVIIISVIFRVIKFIVLNNHTRTWLSEINCTLE